MSLQDRFFGQKKGVAYLIQVLFGQNGLEMAAILERELGEQIHYDHREVTSSELDAQWRALPAITDLIGQGNVTDLEALKASSYAFRLMSMAQCLNRLPPTSSPALQAILDEFGLGMKEVEAYVTDFVR